MNPYLYVFSTSLLRLNLKAQLVIRMRLHTWMLIWSCLYTVRGHYLSEFCSGSILFKRPNQNREPKFSSFYHPPLFLRRTNQGARRPAALWVAQWCEWMTGYGERAPTNQRASFGPSHLLAPMRATPSKSAACRGWIFKCHVIMM